MTTRTFIITGAFGALGSGVSRVAGSRGARVALLDYAEEAPAGLVEACGPGAFALGGVDLSDPASASAAIEDAAGGLGGVDALVNIAGGFRFQKVTQGDPAAWEQMYALNLATALNACRAAIPLLRKSAAGRIVNIGALAALRAGAGMGPYTASKAAVHKLTESLAAELKDDGITVNAILPSTIDTPANRRDMPDKNPADWVTAEDIANAILFLASPEAKAITGALLPVRGKL
jgi:NAD(P)-dependent dehydrogenase (short-subunit alcohol dehydrogenase family)